MKGSPHILLPWSLVLDLFEPYEIASIWPVLNLQKCSFHMVQPDAWIWQTEHVNFKSPGHLALFFGWQLIQRLAWSRWLQHDADELSPGSEGHAGFWSSLFLLPHWQAPLQAATWTVMFHMGPGMASGEAGFSLAAVVPGKWRALWCPLAWHSILGPVLCS